MAEVALQFMPDEDQKEKELVQKSLAKSREASKHKQSKSSQDGRGGVTQIRKEPVPVDPSFSLAKAKKLIPRGVGITLNREETYHVRVCAEYVNRRTPGDKYHKRCYTDGESERRAFVDCLQWLWAVHFLETGEQCPYEWAIQT
eukprot:4021336-Amphidinium_carterae.1